MRRMITTKQSESVNALSVLTDGSKYYEEPALPISMTFDEVDWDNSEIEYSGNGEGYCNLWINATKYPENFACYDDVEAAPCVNWYLSLSGLPETITDADELIEFMKQGGLKEEYIEESEKLEWNIGYIYPDGYSAVIEPQEVEFNVTTLVAIGSELKVIGMPAAELLVNGNINVTKDLKVGQYIQVTKDLNVGQDLRVIRNLEVNSIKPAPGFTTVTVSNLKVAQNVNVDGWIAGKEQTWGYTMTERITEGTRYNADGSATFGNGQKGELKVVALVDDDAPVIIADFEFNQTAVNDQYVQFTYPIRYLDTDENWHWGHLIVYGKLVGSDKKSHLHAYIVGDNGTELTLTLPIENASYGNDTYGIKIEVLPH